MPKLLKYAMKRLRSPDLLVRHGPSDRCFGERYGKPGDYCVYTEFGEAADFFTLVFSDKDFRAILDNLFGGTSVYTVLGRCGARDEGHWTYVEPMNAMTVCSLLLGNQVYEVGESNADANCAFYSMYNQVRNCSRSIDDARYRLGRLSDRQHINMKCFHTLFVFLLSLPEFVSAMCGYFVLNDSVDNCDQSSDALMNDYEGCLGIYSRGILLECPAVATPERVLGLRRMFHDANEPIRRKRRMPLSKFKSENYVTPDYRGFVGDGADPRNFIVDTELMKMQVTSDEQKEFSAKRDREVDLFDEEAVARSLRPPPRKKPVV